MMDESRLTKEILFLNNLYRDHFTIEGWVKP